MIFNEQQWREIYRRWEDSAREWEPNEIIMAAIEHDALEYGIHPTWIELWNEADQDAWESCLCLLGDRSAFADRIRFYRMPFDEGREALRRGS